MKKIETLSRRYSLCG